MLIAYRDACQSSVQAIWGPWIGARSPWQNYKGRPREIHPARLHEQIERLPVPANALPPPSETAGRLRSAPASSNWSTRRKR